MLVFHDYCDKSVVSLRGSALTMCIITNRLRTWLIKRGKDKILNDEPLERSNLEDHIIDDWML